MAQNIFRPGNALLRSVPDLALHSFEVFLDPTNTLSERACKRTTLIRSALIPALQFFEDGITRRSAKLSQAAKPPLESRGALFECRAPTKH